MKHYDLAYFTACEDAREDAYYRGVHRTQQEVESEAERYRRLEQERPEKDGGQSC